MTTSVALALSSFGAFTTDAGDCLESIESSERSGFSKAPCKLASAIAVAEETTGASVLTVDFVDAADTEVYTVQLLAQDGTQFQVIVDLEKGRIEKIPA